MENLPVGSARINAQFWKTPDGAIYQYFDNADKFIEVGRKDTVITTTVAAMSGFTGTLRSNYFITTDIEGNWYYDAADKTSADNYGLVRVTADGKRIKRYIAGPINVKWFGAKGDAVVNGTTGVLTSGTDDTATFDKAITTIRALGGGTLFIPTAKTGYALTKLGLKSGVSIKTDSPNVKIYALPSNEPGFVYMADSPVQNADFEGFRLYGNVQNTTQHGLYMKATGEFDTYHTGGLWYCNFKNIQIGGFKGNQIHFECVDADDAYVGNDIANQFLTFTNVRAFAYASATSRCLYTYGQFGQVQFIQCQFDGSTGNQNIIGSTAVEIISNGTGSDNAYDVQFIGVTIQTTDIGYRFHYAKASIDNGHFEVTNRLVVAVASSSISINNGSEIYSQLTDKNKYHAVLASNSSVSVIGCNISAGYFVSENGSIYLGTNNTVGSGYLLTSGSTVQAAVGNDGVLNTSRYRNLLVNAKYGDLKTISSNLGTDDRIVLRGWDNGETSGYTRIIDDGATGNITLPQTFLSRNGSTRELILRRNDVVVLVRADLAVRPINTAWILESYTAFERKLPNKPSMGYWFAGEKFYNSAYSETNPVIGWICRKTGYTTNTPWGAAKVYGVGDVVVANSNIYIVTTAGTSGTVAPSGTTTFNDGTVVWAFTDRAVFEEISPLASLTSDFTI